MIEAERQACFGRLAARLMQSGKAQGLQDWAGLFSPLPAQWREVALQPYIEQISSLLATILPDGSLSEDLQKIPPVYGNEANLVQAVLFSVDFALSEMPASGQLHWRALPLATGGIELVLISRAENTVWMKISLLLRPLKTLIENSLPLGPYLTAAIAHQHGGTLVIRRTQGED